MVYVFRMGNTDFYKVGYTANDDVGHRCGSLQTGCPEKLTVYAILDGDRSIEADLHRRLWRYRTNGGSEWFCIPGDKMGIIHDKQTAHQHNGSVPAPDGEKDVYGQERPKQKYFIMSLSSEDDIMFDQLTEIYRLDKSNLVRYALSRLVEALPPGTVIKSSPD